MWGVKLAPKRPIIFHPHFSDGVQDLSCAALLQDKSCIPVETDEEKLCEIIVTQK
jgi:hypothetical protein